MLPPAIPLYGKHYDVKMVRKKITGFCQKRVQFGDFFLKISLVFHLASHPLVQMHPKKDRSNQRKRAKMINNNNNPITDILSLRTATQLKDNYLC